MRRILSALLGLSILAAAPTAAHAQSFEDEVLAELNRVRADPAGLARDLMRDAASGRAEAYLNPADPDALDEAVAFLRRQAPLGPLAAHSRLADAAFQHVSAQGPRGDVGHGAPGSLGRRLQQQGVFAGLMAESISYGQASPRDVVRQLVVDAGVPNRGHRRDVFSAAWQAAGVACGPHRVWGGMCVIEYAGGLVARN